MHPQYTPTAASVTSYYSSHYAQAYIQSYPTARTTPEGYTLSSTYEPSSSSAKLTDHVWDQPTHPITNNYPQKGTSSQQKNPFWYQPGSNRCTYKNCTFSGSHKSVEIHMMDRHLIYPPGWDKRKKSDNWDADPSLKGKPIPIQGTTIILDSPETLESWIAERKKRWPTTARITETKRKLEEAISRGQLPPVETGFRPHKRQRMDSNHAEDYNRSSMSSRGRGRGRGRVRGHPGSRGMRREVITHHPAPPAAPGLYSISTYPDFNDSSDDSDEDDQPEVVSSKIPLPLGLGSPKINNTELSFDPDLSVQTETAINPASQAKTTADAPKMTRPKPPPAQPKRQPHNQFASRPTLLRNLLLPEIRITISNLSQAIRFLVDNDFLSGVELKPGDADNKMIQVINENE